MHHPNPFSSSTLHHVASLISRSPLWRGYPVVLLVLGLFALSPTALAVDPPPDGGYPNGNTAEGEQALNSLMDGYVGNTAIGYQALFSTSAGAHNTGVGFQALFSNSTGSANTAPVWQHSAPIQSAPPTRLPVGRPSRQIQLAD